MHSLQHHLVGLAGNKQLLPSSCTVPQGTGSKDEAAPPTRRMPLPKGATMASTTLQQALELLKPPRSLGPHPDDQSPITVQQGRFGPYAAHRTLNAPLPKGLTPETVSLEEALAAIERKVARAAKQGVDPYAVSWGIAVPCKPKQRLGLHAFACCCPAQQ